MRLLRAMSSDKGFLGLGDLKQDVELENKYRGKLIILIESNELQTENFRCVLSETGYMGDLKTYKSTD